MTAPNMSKEYRKELRQLRAKLRALARDYARTQKEEDRQLVQVIRTHGKILKGIGNQMTATEKRIAIVEGRIAK